MGLLSFLGGALVGALVFFFPFPRKSGPSCPLCDNRSDPRCGGGNCSHHCYIYCRSHCLDAWAKSGEAFDLAKQVLEKSKQ